MTTLQITSTRPFGNGYLNFNANTPEGPIEGIAWDAEIQHHFQQGSTVSIEVGTSKSDGAFWNTYKGRTRLEVNKAAKIAAQAPQTAPDAPQPGAYHPPQFGAPTPPAAPQAPQQPSFAAPSASPAKTEEEVLQHACALAARAADILTTQHKWDEGDARRIAGQMAQCWPSYWFGEKGV